MKTPLTLVTWEPLTIRYRSTFHKNGILQYRTDGVQSTQECSTLTLARRYLLRTSHGVKIQAEI